MTPNIAQSYPNIFTTDAQKVSHMASTSSAQCWQGASVSSTRGIKLYTKEDFLKEFCGGMSSETLQEILHKYASEYLI